MSDSPPSLDSPSGPTSPSPMTVSSSWLEIVDGSADELATLGQDAATASILLQRSTIGTARQVENLQTRRVVLVDASHYDEQEQQPQQQQEQQEQQEQLEQHDVGETPVPPLQHEEPRAPVYHEEVVGSLVFDRVPHVLQVPTFAASTTETNLNPSTNASFTLALTADGGMDDAQDADGAVVDMTPRTFSPMPNLAASHFAVESWARWSSAETDAALVEAAAAAEDSGEADVLACSIAEACDSTLDLPTASALFAQRRSVNLADSDDLTGAHSSAHLSPAFEMIGSNASECSSFADLDDSSSQLVTESASKQDGSRPSHEATGSIASASTHASSQQLDSAQALLRKKLFEYHLQQLVAQQQQQQQQQQLHDGALPLDASLLMINVTDVDDIVPPSRDGSISPARRAPLPVAVDVLGSLAASAAAISSATDDGQPQQQQQQQVGAAGSESVALQPSSSPSLSTVLIGSSILLASPESSSLIVGASAASSSTCSSNSSVVDSPASASVNQSQSLVVLHDSVTATVPATATAAGMTASTSASQDTSGSSPTSESPILSPSPTTASPSSSPSKRHHAHHHSHHHHSKSHGRHHKSRSGQPSPPSGHGSSTTSSPHGQSSRHRHRHASPDLEEQEEEEEEAERIIFPGDELMSQSLSTIIRTMRGPTFGSGSTAGGLPAVRQLFPTAKHQPEEDDGNISDDDDDGEDDDDTAPLDPADAVPTPLQPFIRAPQARAARIGALDEAFAQLGLRDGLSVGRRERLGDSALMASAFASTGFASTTSDSDSGTARGPIFSRMEVMDATPVDSQGSETEIRDMYEYSDMLWTWNYQPTDSASRSRHGSSPHHPNDALAEGEDASGLKRRRLTRTQRDKRKQLANQQLELQAMARKGRLRRYVGAWTKLSTYFLNALSPPNSQAASESDSAMHSG